MVVVVGRESSCGVPFATRCTTFRYARCSFPLGSMLSSVTRAPQMARPPSTSSGSAAAAAAATASKPQTPTATWAACAAAGASGEPNLRAEAFAAAAAARRWSEPRGSSVRPHYPIRNAAARRHVESVGQYQAVHPEPSHPNRRRASVPCRDGGGGGGHGRPFGGRGGGLDVGFRNAVDSHAACVGAVGGQKRRCAAGGPNWAVDESEKQPRVGGAQAQDKEAEGAGGSQKRMEVLQLAPARGSGGDVGVRRLGSGGVDGGACGGGAREVRVRHLLEGVGRDTGDGDGQAEGSVVRERGFPDALHNWFALGWAASAPKAPPRELTRHRSRRRACGGPTRACWACVIER
eukprot:scaffold2148_cov137-Isochrysis_galbana.AAC.3